MFKKWLKNTLRHILFDQPVEEAEVVIGKDYSSSFRGEESISFDLTPAIGGHILVVNRYDRKINDKQVYVISSENNIGERVTKILNLEMLK